MTQTDSLGGSTDQSDVCVDELQQHLAGWSVIRRRLLADRRLRTHLPSIWNVLDASGRRLTELSRCAVKWTSRIVRTGFRVLAHSDLDRISADTLWNVARGLEQFNCLAASTPLRGELQPARGTSWRGSYRPRRRRSGPVTLSTVLHLLATERSKYAAASAVEHFAANPEFLRLVLGRGPRIPSPSWLPLVVGDGGARTAIPEGVDVEDVVGQPSPLVDFNRRETTFAARFLHVVCHSTSLIRPNSATEIRPGLVRPDSAVEHRPNGAEAAELGTSAGDEMVARKERVKRKNVSWGDASLSVAVQDTARRYVSDIWRMFARHLANFLVNLEYKETRRESRGRLGSIVVCRFTASLLLQRAIEHAASDGQFLALLDPVYTIQPVLQQIGTSGCIVYIQTFSCCPTRLYHNISSHPN